MSEVHEAEARVVELVAGIAKLFDRRRQLFTWKVLELSEFSIIFHQKPQMTKFRTEQFAAAISLQLAGSLSRTLSNKFLISSRESASTACSNSSAISIARD